MSTPNKVEVSQVSDVTTVEVTTAGPQGPAISGVNFDISFPSIMTDPDFNFKSPSMAFMAVDLPAPLGPKIATISPLLTFMEQELIISGPLP